MLAKKDKWKKIVVDVSGVKIGKDFVVIAGPCSVESYEQLYETAREVKKYGANILRAGCFKPRTSPYSFQGIGMKALDILADVSKKLKIPFVTEVLDVRDVEIVSKVADMIQIGARNMQNYPLLKEVGRQEKPVLLKRNPGATIDELLYSAEYIMLEGNKNVVLCERGIRTYERSTRYTLDICAVPVLKSISCLPVIIDPSHAAGNREYVIPLAKAAIASGADGIMVEVHINPEKALSDKEQQITPKEFSKLMKFVKSFKKLK
jgi:3-deoxy-7-phosphoheptulonate synthase